MTVPYAKFGDPQSLNLYSYTENGPINKIDPDGHFDDPFGTFSGGDTGNSNMQSRFYQPDNAPQEKKAQNHKKKQKQKQKQSKPKIGLKIVKQETIPASNPGNQGGTAGSPVPLTGLKAKVTYQVTIDGGPAPGLTIQENVPPSVLKTPTQDIQYSGTSGFQDIGPTAAGGTGTTDGQGEFVDAPLGTYAPSAFSYSFSQSLQGIDANGNIYDLGTNNVTESSKGIGKGTTMTITNPQMNINITITKPDGQ